MGGWQPWGLRPGDGPLALRQASGGRRCGGSSAPSGPGCPLHAAPDADRSEVTGAPRSRCAGRRAARQGEGLLPFPAASGLRSGLGSRAQGQAPLALLFLYLFFLPSLWFQVSRPSGLGLSRCQPTCVTRACTFFLGEGGKLGLGEGSPPGNWTPPWCSHMYRGRQGLLGRAGQRGSERAQGAHPALSGVAGGRGDARGGEKRARSARPGSLITEAKHLPEPWARGCWELPGAGGGEVAWVQARPPPSSQRSPSTGRDAAAVGALQSSFPGKGEATLVCMRRGCVSGDRNADVSPVCGLRCAQPRGRRSARQPVAWPLPPGAEPCLLDTALGLMLRFFSRGFVCQRLPLRFY